MGRKVLAVFNDIHSNNRRGLLNPGTVLQKEDETGKRTDYTPALTATQVYLWRLYGWCLEALTQVAAGDPIILLHNGDECQGNKYPSDHVSATLGDEILIAVQNFNPVFKLPNLVKLILSDGTEAHNYGFSSSTMLVTKLLKALHPKVDIRESKHGLLDIDGYEVDFAHKGPGPGIREWLRGNIARLYLISIMEYELKTRGRCPNLVLRAHFHSAVEASHTTLGPGFKHFSSKLRLVPSFCGMDEHSNDASRSAGSITFGMYAQEIVDGHEGQEWYFYDTLDQRERIMA